MTVAELQAYYQKASAGEKDRIVKTILSTDPPKVVYGGKSVNALLPEYLHGTTRDWDIYSHDARETAGRLEQRLDEEFGGDYFEVQPAKHEGTFRVVSKVTGTVVADVSFPDKTISYHVVDGIRYATLDEQVTNIKRILTEPESKFRWPKDLETLQRINVYRELYPDIETRPTFRLKPGKDALPGVTQPN